MTREVCGKAADTLSFIMAAVLQDFTVSGWLWKSTLRTIRHIGGWKLGWEPSRKRDQGGRGAMWVKLPCCLSLTTHHCLTANLVWPVHDGRSGLHCRSSQPPFFSQPEGKKGGRRGQKESKHTGQALVLYTTSGPHCGTAAELNIGSVWGWGSYFDGVQGQSHEGISQRTIV